MSTDTEAVAEAIELSQSIFVNNCCGYAALTLLFFEYAITFDREVNLFWKRKFTGATTLFLANRYIPLLLQIVDMCGYATMSDQRWNLHSCSCQEDGSRYLRITYSCSALTFIAQTIQVLQYAPWAAFSALRAYALSGPSLLLGFVTLLLSSVPIGVNLTQYRWLVGFNDPTYGCTNSLLIPEYLVHPLTIASRTCTIAADVLVIVVTWAATRRIRGFRLNGHVGRTLSAVLFEYGTIYFVILTILNALHLSFTLVSLASDAISPVSYVTVFTEPITAVLISRFLFDLQEANTDSTGSSPSHYFSSRASTIDFARPGVDSTVDSTLISQQDPPTGGVVEMHDLKDVRATDDSNGAPT